MSSFSTVEVYSINDTNFWYVETGDVPTPDAWAIGPESRGITGSKTPKLYALSVK
jgi:hypothetical protein